MSYCRFNSIGFCLTVMTMLNGCNTHQDDRQPIISAITNKSSANCLTKDSAGMTKEIVGCDIGGKMILTSPTDNLSYVLYRKNDRKHLNPVLCTLPAQAADALTRIRKVNAVIPLAKGGLTAGGEKQDNTTVISLNKDDDMSPSLYVLSSNFALCMSYGSNAIDEKTFAQLLSKTLDNAAGRAKQTDAVSGNNKK